MESREQILAEMAEKLGVPREVLGQSPVFESDDWRMKTWEHFTDLVQDALAVSQIQAHLDERFGPGVYEVVYACEDPKEPWLTQVIRARRSSGGSDE